MGFYEISMYFKKIGVIFGKDIIMEVVLGKMMFLLGKSVKFLEFKILFENLCCGEMD